MSSGTRSVTLSMHQRSIDMVRSSAEVRDIPLELRRHGESEHIDECVVILD